MTATTKLIVIIGITGNQGGSVAKAFLNDPGWKIRGLSRNVESATARDLTSQGIEMVQADLDKPETLITAFTGANLIFSVTDFWQFFFDPAHQSAAIETGITPGQYAYEHEVQHGQNIADAAASSQVLATLDENVGFIASTLSSARKWTGGSMRELWHFDSKADVFPTYVVDKHPELARRMSFLQTGVFMSSWRYSPQTFMGWNDDLKAHEMRFSAPPDGKLPHLDVRRDTGLFAKALLQLPVGSVLMAAGAYCSWSEYMATWGKLTGRKTRYTQVTTAEMDRMIPGGFGKEIGDMWEYSGNPGYDGGDPNVLYIEDLRKAGISFEVTSLEDYMEREDYSTVLNTGSAE